MASPVLTAFNSGELSPLLDGRTDLQKYGSGCRTLENFFILPQGGVERRPGTEYIGEAKSHDSKCRLIPFIFSEGQSAVLEFGDLYMRVWRDGGQVTTDAGAIYEIVTPYSADEVFQLAYAQSADVVYLAHQAHPPQKLSRTGWADWELEAFDPTYGAFREENTEGEIEIVPSFPAWATGTAYKKNDIVSINTAWASDAEYVKDDVVYKAADPQKFYKCTRANDDEDPLDGKPYWKDHFQLCFRCLNDHTSTTAGTNPTPPGNTTDWEVAETNLGGSLTVRLNASDDIFDPDMIGGLFLLRHPRDDNSIDKRFDMGDEDEEVSEAIQVEGTWTFITHGNWGGEIAIERSFDNGNTWEKYRQYSSYIAAGLGERNLDTDGEEDEPNVLYRIIKYELDPIPTGTGGKCTVDFVVRDYLVDGSILVTDFIDEKTIVGEIVMMIGSPKKTTKWAEGAWSEKNGYPAAITMFEERLVFAGSVKDPQDLWFSRSNDYEDFTPGTFDSSAMTFTLSSDTVDAIKWIVPKQELIIGTSASEWKFGASKASEPLTPTNLSAKRQTTYGSGDIPGMLVNDSVMFFQEHEKTLRELTYSFERDMYVAPSMTVMSEHITGEGIVQIAGQRHPYPIIWCVRADGQICTLTYNREEEVVGWSRQITDGLFESVAVISGDGEDEVWVVVQREIDGATKRYVERFSKRDFGADLKDARFLDSHLHYAVPSPLPSIEAIYNNWCIEDELEDGYEEGMASEYFLLTGWPEGAEYLYCDILTGLGETTIKAVRFYLDEARTQMIGSTGTTSSARMNEHVVVSAESGYSLGGAIWLSSSIFASGNAAAWRIKRVMAMKLSSQLPDGAVVEVSGFSAATTFEGRRLLLEQSWQSQVYLLRRVADGEFFNGEDFPEFDLVHTVTKVDGYSKWGYDDSVLDSLFNNATAHWNFDTDGFRGKSRASRHGAAVDLDDASAYMSIVTGKNVDGAEKPTGGKMILDGGDDAASLIMPSETRDYSIAFWMKSPQATIPSGSPDVYLLAGRGDGGGNLVIVLKRYNSGNFQMWVKVMGLSTKRYWKTGTATTLAQDTSWHLYEAVFTWNGSGQLVITLKRDGAVKATYTETRVTSWSGGITDSPFFYMLYGGDKAMWTHQLDEVSLWRAALPTSNNLPTKFLTLTVVNDFYQVTYATYTMGGNVEKAENIVVSGLDYLEGKDVEATIDGACHEPMTVTSGDVTLNRHSGEYVIGLPFTSALETMRMEGEIADGGSHARKKRITEVTIRFRRTVNGRTISPEGEEDIISFRNTTDSMNAHLPMFDGDKKVKFSTGYNKDMTVQVVQDSPMPMTILLISPKIWTYQ